MQISTKAIDLDTAEAIILGEYANKTKKTNYSKEFQDLDKKLSGFLSESIKEEAFEFQIAQTLVIRINSTLSKGRFKNLKKIILLGLGAKDNFDLKAERTAIAAGIRAANAIKVEKLAIKSLNTPALLAETAILLSYTFDKYKTSKEDKKSLKSAKKLEEIIILDSKIIAKDKAAIKNAEIIATSACLARDLVWEPACVVTPTYLANQAKKIKGIQVKILEKADCSKLKMGAFLAVAQGADQPPKFIEMTYTPKGKVKKHIALVGKGVTFDSGGLSLKPAKSMEMMKEDMSGAASVIGVMTAIAKLQPAGIKITAIVAATENMPSGNAYRPGDVITAMNGMTIEVNNTDAEGRLTLADAVNYVSKKNPDEIIDIATLTGACMVALGNVCAGLMTNDQALLERVKKSADKQGELMWQLPLFEEYKEKLKSPIADLINAGSGGQAGAQNGGLFIQEFIGKKAKSSKQIPWLHIDIAGPCWLEAENSWSPKGASGIPVRTLLDYILSH